MLVARHDDDDKIQEPSDSMLIVEHLYLLGPFLQGSVWFLCFMAYQPLWVI